MLGWNRRRFLLAALGAAGTAGAGAAWWLGNGPLAGLRTSGEPVTKTGWALGTTVSVSVVHADRGLAERAAAAALAAIAEVDRAMSLYRPDSSLARLNRQGVLDDPPAALIELLQYADGMSRRTRGAFDATVQPLWTLYAEARRAGRAPSRAEVARELPKVGWDRVEMSAGQVRLLKATRITLNGVAQGFAADRAAAALRRKGVTRALINTGEVGALGVRGDGQPWTVGIEHPRQADAFLALAKLGGRSLSTSGDYATRFSDDYQNHHLFDPHTGRSPEQLAAVSVAAATAVEADALSTAVFVLGAEAGLELVASTPGADALLVFKDGRTLATARFPAELV